MDFSDWFFSDEQLTDPALKATFLIFEWISQSTPREQRRFLEEHTELLNSGTERMLKLLLAVLGDQQTEFQQLAQVSEDRVSELFEKYKTLLTVLSITTGGVAFLQEGQELCDDLLKTLEIIRATGDSVEAIRRAFVDIFGGLQALDIPPWLEQGVQSIIKMHDTGQQSSRQEVDRWHKLIQRAEHDKDVPREAVAQLRLVQASTLLRDTSSTNSRNLAIAALQAALEVFSIDRYPLQHAKLQDILTEISSSRKQNNKQQNATVEITEVNEPSQSADSSVDMGEVLIKLGAFHLAQAELHTSKTDCAQAKECFQQALEIYTRETFPEQWATCQLYLGVTYSLLDKGKNDEDLDVTLDCFQSALKVFSREAFPEQWATTHLYYATVLYQLIAQGKQKNETELLDHLMSALEVFSREAFPEQWANGQVMLGNLFAGFSGATYFEDARRYYEAALEVFQSDSHSSERAKCYLHLGNLYGNLKEERNSTQREQAIHYFEEALKCYDARSWEWAMIQMSLGTAYRNRLQGDPGDNIREAIDCCTQALNVFEQDTSSLEWAQAQNALVIAYKDLGGDETNSVEKAISACQAALQVYTRNTYPEEWAGTQQNLGMLYLQRKSGVRNTNLERALQHFLAALQVFTRNEYSHEWAMVQRNLAMAYSLRFQGERADNIERAINHNEAVLSIYTRDNFPSHWTATQVVLAHLYNERVWGDEQENQEKALQACQMALAELSREAHPMEWASAQLTLANIYENRLTDAATENLVHAALCYEAALQVYQLELHPEQCRVAQLALARIQGLQGNWQAVHEAYAQARLAEDLLIREGAGLVGQHLAIGHLSTARDAGARAGFALIRLGKLEEGLVAIERGQARIMAASLEMDAADPTRIIDAGLRERYIQKRQAYIRTQEALNRVLPANIPEEERRLWQITYSELFHIEQAALEQVIREIRATHALSDPMEDTASIPMILQAAERGGAGHALVYLMATPWGGMAVAIFTTNHDRHSQARIAAFDLPGLRDEIVADLLSNGLTTETPRPVVGGFAYAQQHGGFGFLLRDWRGVSFQGYAEQLHDTCFLEGKVGMLDYAAQDILHDPGFAQIITQPLKSLQAKDFFYLMHRVDAHFLSLELERVLRTLAHAGIPQLVDWLVTQGATSLTFVPCGWLATLPLAAVPCKDENTVGDILPTSLAPNARSLLQNNGASNKKRSGVYTLGDTLPNRAPLPWSEAEALTIAQLARLLNKRGGVKVQSQAKREWLIDALEKGHVVDASCHGHFDQHDFLRSALRLANKDLTLGDMLSHRVDLRGLRLLILSACQTASADIEGAAANEVKSLAVGMLQAGAEAILATLWPVHDRATFVLIVRFAQEWFPNMESEPPAKALARAQQWIRTRTNRELEHWRTTELPPTMPEETYEAGKETSKETIPQAEEDIRRILADIVTVGMRSYRYDMGEAQELLRFEAKKGDPDSCPYADPIYWAGFQITGW